MHLDALRITGFRCFDAETTLDMSDTMTCFIGDNGSGKTAVMSALSRLFGIGGRAKTVVPSDFHQPVGSTSLEDGAELVLDAEFAFDEDDPNIPAFWAQMGAGGEGDEPLRARMALKAVWSDDGTPEGAIDTQMVWAPPGLDDIGWEGCTRVKATERASVQALYIPANRGADAQVRALLRDRLWRAAKWSDALREAVTDRNEQTQQAFQSENVTSLVQEQLRRRWQTLERAGTQLLPTLEITETRFDALIRQVGILFENDAGDGRRELARMSDGQKSLFEIALTSAILDIEWDVAKDAGDELPFDPSLTRHVPLTLLMLEEPENSLSPFYLSRIVSVCEDVGSGPRGQVVVSSHSPAILSRIKPECVRHCRMDTSTGRSNVRALTLPSDAEEAGKYIRRAVRAYPELYFARLVILGEGDSERIVIPALAEAQDISLDQSFCPVVPLSGRYAAHLWRLLRDLGIPHITLLDLDWGRKGGGAQTLKQAAGHLVEFDVDFSQSTSLQQAGLTADSYETLDDATAWAQQGQLGPGDHWIAALQEQDVFFSSPIDLDFAMVKHFPQYRMTPSGTGGPRVYTAERMEQWKKRTLKPEGNAEGYTDPAYNEAFRWYPYLFLSKSKPVSHLRALTRIPKAELAAPPAPLDALINRVRALLLGA